MEKLMNVFSCKSRPRERSEASQDDEEVPNIGKTDPTEVAATSGNTHEQEGTNAEGEKLDNEKQKFPQQPLSDDKNAGGVGMPVSKKQKKKMEKSALRTLLKEHNLRLIYMPEDGDCLYRSISDQLQIIGFETSVEDLRQQVAKFMREHREDYEPFISKRDIPGYNESKKSKEPKTDDPEKEKDNIWEEFLKATERIGKARGCWGGEIETSVLSLIYERPIVILKAEGGEQTYGEQFVSPNKQPLKIVFYENASQGPHYNSTQPV